MNESLRYVRSVTTNVKPPQKEIQEAILKAQEIQRTESARMQFPKTENW